MGENKIIQIAESKQAAAKAHQTEFKAYHEQEFLHCIEKINRALQKTGEEPRTLAHLFLHMSMVLSDGGFHKLSVPGADEGVKHNV